MPSDCYKVDVIHYLNPSLIWVEVCDPSMTEDDFVFEQIGVYGIVPNEATIDVETESVVLTKCTDWVPAANEILKSFLCTCTEVWFLPTHIDRRSSIFDDNIHKYGELIIKNSDGKIKKISKCLVRSGFAEINVDQFHSKLSKGELNTKLDSIKTQEVIKQLEKHYSKSSKKKEWEGSVKKQTTVFQMKQQFESQLTVSNLEKHNNIMIRKVIENKSNDFELCKDVNEEPLGRGFHKVNSNKGELKSNLLKKKTSCHDKTSFDEIKRFLEINSKAKDDDSASSVSGLRAGVENGSNILSRRLRQFNNPEYKFTAHNKPKTQMIAKEKCKNMYENDEVYERSKKPAKPTKLYDKHKDDSPDGAKYGRIHTNRIKNLQNTKFPTEDEEEMEKTKKLNKPMKIYDEDVDTYTSPDSQCGTAFKNRTKNLQNTRADKILTEDDEIKNQKILIPAARKKNTVKTENGSGSMNFAAFGPPELHHTKFKVVQIPPADTEHILIEKAFEKEHMKEHGMYGNVDSDVDFTSDDNNYGGFIKICDTNSGQSDSKVSEGNGTLLSYVLQRRLRARDVVRNNESSISSSDTNRDSSSVGENKESFDDDEVTEIIDKKYAEAPSRGVDSVDDSVDVKLKNNVNPFKNVDSSISVFVDKLVTPVLMLHSKANKRIEPVFEMRELHFNPHIRLVLRNMSIEKLMMLQTVSWYTILRGYSLFMVSPMGSGKTMGYLPAVCRLVSDGSGDIVNSSGPMCIIVCATAKSVAEVEELARILLGLEERVLACYAGVDGAYVTTSLLNGCDILVCTPPALARLMRVNDFGIDLRRLSIFVLDDCERLSVTYGDELKFFQIKINAMLKNRVNKELKVQYVIASRVWCDFMAPLAKRAPDTVMCIGAFQECVLYSKAKTCVSFIKSEHKLEHVLDFLNTIDASKRTVIVCGDDNEVELLQRALRDLRHMVFACDNNMTVHDLYSLSESWAEYREPVLGPILVCCDGNLTHMNITDAHYLIHYSLPQYFSMFCKRFAVLNDNYPSIFKSDNENVSIKILLEESNAQQLPKIVNFIKRCTTNVPPFLDKICAEILAEKDLMKAESLVPLCDNLLQLGVCPDFHNCQERHTILKDYDTPKTWLPKNGVITFKIIHYHTAVLYSARLLSVAVDGTISKFPQTYSTLSLKIGMYFGKESNRKLHGMPEVGDVCAVAVKLNFYARCQVLKILSRYQRGNPNKVLVKLIDEEKYEITRDIYLYYLPDEFKEIETRVVQIRLANMEPQDKDITFSDLARDHLKTITDSDDELFMRGQVSLALGNCLFLTTLEVCQDLSSLSETVVKYNFKHELLKNHAIINSEHLDKIEKLCKESGLEVNEKSESFEANTEDENLAPKNLPKGCWAHLEREELCSVFFASAISPDKFFVRLEKFESCMSMLLEDIKTYVQNNTKVLSDIKEGDIVLAKFLDDSTYERARIDSVDGGRAKCFFVDQGDWRDVETVNLVPIDEKIINKLPFQAIECRLVGVKPPGEEWTDFCTNWFCNSCYESDGENLKHLFVKFYTKESAEFTDGPKYGVVLVDTSSDQDIVINELLIGLSLAQENEEEIKYFENIHSEIKQNKYISEADNEERHSESDQDQNEVGKTTAMFPVEGQQPLRSIPLVNSDEESEDSDKWEVNISADVATNLFQTVNKKQIETPDSNEEKLLNISSKMKLPAITSKSVKQELDSDDLTSPEMSEISKTPEKRITLTDIDQKRRPKLIWRQNKTTVHVKIQLVVDDYDLKIENRKLDFSAVANDTKNEFDVELFGVINKEKSTHVNKGQYVLVKLEKLLNKNWLTLTRDGGIKKWVVYDVDFIDTSSDEEVIDDSSYVNIVKNIHENADSESEEDEFYDDANFSYKR